MIRSTTISRGCFFLGRGGECLHELPVLEVGVSDRRGTAAEQDEPAQYLDTRRIPGEHAFFELDQRAADVLLDLQCLLDGQVVKVELVRLALVFDDQRR